MRGILKATGVAALVLLLAAPAVAQGRPGGRGPAMGRGMMQGGPEGMIRNPVTVVLDHQDELQLTDEQVSTLEGLKAQIEEQNGPRWEQLRAAFGDADPREMTVEQRQALRAKMQELAPVRDSIREANRAVGEQIHALLTAEQQDALRGIMRRGPMAPGGRPGPAMGAARRGMRAMGSAYAVGFRQGWARGFMAARRGARMGARRGGWMGPGGG